MPDRTDTATPAPQWSATPIFQVGAVVLGYVGLVASWRRQSGTTRTNQHFPPQVIVTCCADTDDGAHTPAQSITINSREGLLALRAAIDEALREPTP